MGFRHEHLWRHGFGLVAVVASGLAWTSWPGNPHAAGMLALVGSAQAEPRLRLSLNDADVPQEVGSSVPAGTEVPGATTDIVVAVPSVPAAEIRPVAALAPGAAGAPDEPVLTGSVQEIALPEPPPATVAVLPEDAVAGAIGLRLADTANAIGLKRLPRKDRDAIVEFYAARRGEPLWIGRAGWNPRGRAVVLQLARADEDGLDPAQYATPALPAPGGRDSPADLAEAELKLSAAAALYARDARGGRIDLPRLSALITPKLDVPSAETVLAALAASTDPAAALASYNPHQDGYRALKAKLAEIRANRPAGQPMARARVTREIVTHSIAVLDDAPVLKPEGPYANPRLEGDIIANMERWRWLPAEMGRRYVAVNIPEFRLRLMEDGRVTHETRVITGKPDTPTPIFSGLMEYAIVNPSWYIPPSIVKNEILPGLAADPSYAERRGYQVIRHGNQISVRQPPGERNALGFIKFMFPNQHSVYLHDTPNRNLFGSGRRAFSHGCVRVEHPFELADFVLGHDWTEERLKRLIGRGERTLWLPEKLPVHLTYFTVEVDAAGGLRTYEDIYGYNRRVRAALGLGA